MLILFVEINIIIDWILLWLLKYFVLCFYVLTVSPQFCIHRDVDLYPECSDVLKLCKGGFATHMLMHGANWHPPEAVIKPQADNSGWWWTIKLKQNPGHHTVCTACWSALLCHYFCHSRHTTLMVPHSLHRYHSAELFVWAAQTESWKPDFETLRRDSGYHHFLTARRSQVWFKYSPV